MNSDYFDLCNELNDRGLYTAFRNGKEYIPTLLYCIEYTPLYEPNVLDKCFHYREEYDAYEKVSELPEASPPLAEPMIEIVCLDYDVIVMELQKFIFHLCSVLSDKESLRSLLKAAELLGSVHITDDYSGELIINPLDNYYLSKSEIKDDSVNLTMMFDILIGSILTLIDCFKNKQDDHNAVKNLQRLTIIYDILSVLEN